ncbi:MAG: hypothetical protein WCK78_13395 [Paludibacter sp.]
MEHKLHFLIGEHLKSVDFGNVQKISDPACGGKQHIPLFLTEDKSRDNQLCKVDYMIIKNKRIKVIIEIEETNKKPTQILGKLLTSGIAKYYIHETPNYEKIPMADNVCFIQILTTESLKTNSKKREQWNKIENALNEVLPTLKTNIKTYRLFYGDSKNIDLNEITQFIKNELDK